MEEDNLNDNIDEWKMKCMELQNNVAQLLFRCNEAEGGYKELPHKHKLNEQQNEVLNVELRQVKCSLDEHKEALLRFGSASQCVYEEYEDLRGCYRQEVLCRDKAERIAARLYAEKEAAQRQSTMLMMNVSGEKRLMEALLEAETLTTALEEQKLLHELELQNLRDEIESLKEAAESDSAEQEKSMLLEERDALISQLQNARDEVHKLTANVVHLTTAYEKLEKQFELSSRPPPPPPLPPPPPPPVSFMPRILIFGKKKRHELLMNEVEKKGGSTTSSYSQAVDEMMKRIKSGTALRRTIRDGNEDSSHNKVRPLDNCGCEEMLVKLRRPSTDTRVLKSNAIDVSSSELAQAFLRLNAKPNVNRTANNG